MEGKTIENILINLDMKTLFVCGGGFFHNFILDSYDSNGGGLPTGDLTAIEATFEL
jgi:Fe-Mn family superoxide dismutase